MEHIPVNPVHTGKSIHLCTGKTNTIFVMLNITLYYSQYVLFNKDISRWYAYFSYTKNVSDLTAEIRVNKLKRFALYLLNFSMYN